MAQNPVVDYMVKTNTPLDRETYFALAYIGESMPKKPSEDDVAAIEEIKSLRLERGK